MFSCWPSVSPSEARNTLFPPVHGSVVHPTNRGRFTACPSVRLSVRPSTGPSGEVSGYLPENTWREWPELLYADVSWPPPGLFSLLSRSVDFSNLGTISTEWNGSNLEFPGNSWRTHGGNGLKFCMLMYLDHLQIWLFSAYRHYWNHCYINLRPSDLLNGNSVAQKYYFFLIKTGPVANQRCRQKFIQWKHGSIWFAMLWV